MNSQTLEIVEFLDGHHLLYIFEVETIEYRFFDKTFTTNKWLHFGEWQQIYDQLKCSLQKCTSLEMTNYKNQKFRLPRNIEVVVEMFPTENCHELLFSGLQLAATYLKVLIRSVRSEQVVKIEKSESSGIRDRKKKITKRKNTETAVESGSDLLVLSSQDIKPEILSQEDKSEYVPTVSSTVSSYAPYKPAKFTNNDQHEPSDGGGGESDPYSPKPVSSDTLELTDSQVDATPEPIPTYKPSTIVQGKREPLGEKDEYMPTRSTTRKLSRADSQTNSPNKFQKREPSIDTVMCSPPNQIEDYVPSKRLRRPMLRNKVSQDLFGSEEESNDDKKSKKRDQKDADYSFGRVKKKFHAEKEKTTIVKSKGSEKSKSKESSEDKKKSDKKDTSLDKWLSKKPKKAKVEKIQLTSTPLRPKLTEEEMRRNRERDERDIECLKIVQKELQALNKPVERVEILNLNHLEPTDLIKTFEEFKLVLDKFFTKHIKKKSRIVDKPEGMDHLLVLNIIQERHLLPMINHLRKIYDDNEGSLPVYTDLFTNLLLPEWTLAIFMKEHKLTREDAIKRIEIQRELDCSNDSIMMSDMM